MATVHAGVNTDQSTSSSNRLPTAAQKFYVAGQSNMLTLLQDGFFTSQGAIVWGFAEGNVSINYWNENANGWVQTIRAWAGHDDGRAFVWFQGETDAVNGMTTEEYREKLTMLIARVRKVTGKPRLKVFLCEIAAAFSTIQYAQQLVATSVDNVEIIPTWDLTFPDEIHLDRAGATELVSRVLARP